MSEWKLPLALLLTLTACSDDIAPEGAPEEPDAAPPEADASPDQPDAAPTYPHVDHTDEADGVTLTEVNASDMEAWVYLDFDSKAEVGADSTAWDVAFKRFNMELNGGVSGAGMGALVPLPAQAFEAVTTVPAEGFVQDSETSLAIDADGTGWYAYDESTHKLSPQDKTYVIRTAEGGHVKLRFTAYYDDVSMASGYPTFRWKVLP